MRDCPFVLNADGYWRCPQCGWVYPLKDPVPPDRNCPEHRPGLGDVIAWITHKLGIRQCAGCKKRQAWLNRWFPFGRRD